MLTILLALVAFSNEPITKKGELVIDARVPSEVLVDGQQVGQLFVPASLSIEVEAGVRTLRVYTNGTPQDLDVVVPAQGSLHILVGRTGLSIDQTAANTAATEVVASSVPIQVRMNDSIGARLTVDDQRYAIGAGEQIELQLASGPHAVSVRSTNGTVVWSTGTLMVTGPDPVVMQLSEGRLPEVSGKGTYASR